MPFRTFLKGKVGNPKKVGKVEKVATPNRSKIRKSWKGFSYFY